jgi:hypothetical protein
MRTLMFFSALLVSLPLLAQNKGHTEPNVKWNKRSITTCWGKFSDYQKYKSKFSGLPSDASDFIEYTAHEKKVLKALVSSEFSIATTGIEYVGWQDCARTSAPDVFLFKINTSSVWYAGRATIGQTGKSVEETFFSDSSIKFLKSPADTLNYLVINAYSIGYPNLPYAQDLKLVFLHELGHTSGLRHEHIDARAKGEWQGILRHPQDQNCATTGVSSTERASSTTRKFSVYDPNSIMNYCYIFLVEGLGLSIPSLLFTPWIKVDLWDPSIISKTGLNFQPSYKIRIGLSQGDKHSLKCLYQYDERTFKERCHANYNPLGTLPR